MTRGKLIASGVAAFVVGAAGHFHGDELFLDRINTDQIVLEPVLTHVPVATAARRAMVLMIDGLRDEAAFELPALQHMEQLGFIRTVYADFPSFTYPGVVTIATGVPPASSGVRLNWAGPDPPIDSVSRRAADAGFVINIASGAFAPFERLLIPPERFNALSVADALADSAPQTLTWIYFGKVDEAGHRHGTNSQSYRHAAREANDLIERALRTVDLNVDVLFVVSDHGHVSGGGHGGVEPAALRGVWAGAGVGVRRAGRVQPGRLRDVAPTLAVLLDVDLPLHSQGHPDGDVLEADTALVPAYNIESAASQRARSRSSAQRAIIALAIGLAAALFVGKRMKLATHDFAPALIHGVTFFSLSAVAGYRWSWTIPRGYSGFLIETALFSVLGIVIALWVARSARCAEEAAAVALVHGVPYVAFAAYVGLDPRWMTDPFATWGIVLLATLQFYIGIVFGLRSLWFGSRGQQTCVVGT